MSLSDRLKSLGAVLIFIAIAGAVVALVCAFFFGAEWLSVTVEPWLMPAFAWTLVACLLIALPLALIPKTRAVGGLLFYIASFVFGFILWIWSFIVTMSLWGVIGVVIGLLFMGIGIAAVAFVAALFHGEWGTLGNLAILLVATFGARMLGVWLAERSV